MTRKAEVIGIATIVLVLVLAVGIQSWRVHSWKNTAAENALALTNEKATHDFTRASPLSKSDVLKILGDTLASVERLAVQSEKIRTDALDKVLKRQTETIAALTVKIDALNTRVTGKVTGDTGVRSATFDVRKVPYTAHAVATLPAAPAIGSLDLNVSLDAAHFTMRTQCGKPERGISPATTLLTGPKWLPIIVDSTQVDSGVCHSPLLDTTRCRILLFVACPSRKVSFAAGVLASYLVISGNGVKLVRSIHITR